jgi:hypothetical protein
MSNAPQSNPNNPNPAFNPIPYAYNQAPSMKLQKSFPPNMATITNPAQSQPPMYPYAMTPNYPPYQPQQSSHQMQPIPSINTPIVSNPPNTNYYHQNMYPPNPNLIPNAGSTNYPNLTSMVTNPNSIPVHPNANPNAHYNPSAIPNPNHHMGSFQTQSKNNYNPASSYSNEPPPMIPHNHSSVMPNVSDRHAGTMNRDNPYSDN